MERSEAEGVFLKEVWGNFTLHKTEKHFRFKLCKKQFDTERERHADDPAGSSTAAQYNKLVLFRTEET